MKMFQNQLLFARNFRQPPPPIECKYQITLVYKAVKLQGYTTSKHLSVRIDCMKFSLKGTNITEDGNTHHQTFSKCFRNSIDISIW